ncbi:MAG: hypothetical protein IMY76_03520 [Chloroflexi bacterium]|nr:hypothetical protein [Chloroflexota bacterium]
MKKNIYLIAILVALLMATLACSVLETDITPELPQSLLFQDDFSDTSSGWDQVDTTEGSTDYENGYYRIVVYTDNMDVWANPGLTFTDTLIEVDATKAAGPDDNDLGVICRYQDVDNFYFFIISSDGYFAVGKVVDGEQLLIDADQMYPSDAINQGTSANHIQADCVGSQLTFYVNGTELANVSDTTFSDGDVGLIAGTFSEAGADIHFDNFKVSKP